MSRRPGAYFVAFYFPPVDIGSGVFRTICNARAFADDGWEVSVLTASEFALPSLSPEITTQIPAGVEVHRAFALDAQRHLSFEGRYPDVFAIPDRWVSWIPCAFMRGLWHIAAHRPAYVISTSPISSAHVIGWLLTTITGVMWIAEFRDPLLQESYPKGNLLRRTLRKIEILAVKHAEMLVFTTSSSLNFYIERYGDAVGRKGVVIENGYDEQMFARAESIAVDSGSRSTRLRVLHSGSLYPDGRNIEPLLRVLARLIVDGRICEDRILLQIRGSSEESKLAGIVNDLNLANCVEVLPGIGTQEAVREMLDADVLLLIQGKRFNRQIPAKLYEYARCKKPIFALVDQNGDTLQALNQLGIEEFADSEDEAAIAEFILKLVNDCRFANSLRAREEIVNTMSRQSRGLQFSRMLKELLYRDRR